MKEQERVGKNGKSRRSGKEQERVGKHGKE